MFDPATMQETAPVRQERRQLNLEEWRTAVKQHAGARATAGVELGRLFRTLYSALPRAEARRELEAQGFSHLAAAALVKQAAKADGLEVLPPKTPSARTFTKEGAREMLAALEAGEVDAVIDALREALNG